MVIPAPAGEDDFGRRIVAANFNGPDTPIDLAISAPRSNAVYVYLDVDLATGAIGEPVLIPAPEGASDLGATLSAGDVDNDGSDDLLVGAPGSTQGSKTGSGSAYLLQLGVGDRFDAPLTLYDAQPEAGQRFGQAAAILPFADARSLVVIGADDEIFMYFRTLLYGDVRR
jgi:hypothetical protein